MCFVFLSFYYCFGQRYLLLLFSHIFSLLISTVQCSAFVRWLSLSVYAVVFQQINVNLPKKETKTYFIFILLFKNYVSCFVWFHSDSSMLIEYLSSFRLRCSWAYAIFVIYRFVTLIRSYDWRNVYFPPKYFEHDNQWWANHHSEVVKIIKLLWMLLCANCFVLLLLLLFENRLHSQIVEDYYNLLWRFFFGAFIIHWHTTVEPYYLVLFTQVYFGIDCMCIGSNMVLLICISEYSLNAPKGNVRVNYSPSPFDSVQPNMFWLCMK